MNYGETEERKSCHQLFTKYVASVSVLSQSIVLGILVGWPVINIPKLLSPESPIDITTEEVSWMMMLLFFGEMLSPIPSGYLIDKFGRKTTLLYSSVLPIITWLVIGVANKPYQLWISWFSAGLWCGVVYTTIPVYLGEIADHRYRGFVNTMFSIMRRIGIIIQFFVGQYVDYDLLALTVIVLPTLFIIAFVWAPESPYYYLMKDKKTLAKDSLYRLRCGKTYSEVSNGTKDIETEFNEMEDFVYEEMKTRGGFKDLISTKSNRKALLVIETVTILLRISETGSIMGYITATLPKKIFHFLEPGQCVMIIEVIRLISGCVSSVLIDAVGRKILMAVASITCGTAVLLAGMWYFLNSHSNFDVSYLNWAPFLCLVVHNASYCLGLGPVLSSLRSEYFPINTKAKSTAIVSTTLALVSCIINKTFLTTADRIGVHFNYWIFSTSCFLNAIVTIFFILETKGKTLREIQEELNPGTRKSSLINGKL